MTNSLGQPLEIKYDAIDPAVLEVIRKIARVTRNHETAYFLAGATAREVILRHVFGRGPGRRTLDVDFGIAVRHWDHFATLKSALLDEEGFVPHGRIAQRVTYNSEPPVIVDLIPFGGVETADRMIAWPPEENIVMKVAGFSDGLQSAVMVRLDEDLVIPVVGIPVLLVLKLFAWVDRKSEKRDAPDIYTLLKEYGDAGNEDRLYEDDLSVLEAQGYDIELAGALLIGRDAATAISENTKEFVRAILMSDAQMEELTQQIFSLSGRSDPVHFRRCQALVANMRKGFLDDRIGTSGRV